jgi:hypothetical protein
MNAPSPNLRDSALDVINTGEMVRRMANASFQCWRVINGLSYSCALRGETLLDVERELATESNHGGTFLVAETLTISGRTTLHTIRVRRGKPIAWDANAKRIYAYSADRLLSVAVNAFEPVLPWRHTPGCDVLGRSNVIEARP